MKTRADKEKEVKRWTTFLQKPNRPIPKPKSELDKPYQEPYRVRIVRQPKPGCDPTHVPVYQSSSPAQEADTNSLDDFPPTYSNTELVTTVDRSLAANLNELNAATEPKPDTIDTTDINDDDVPDLLECDDQDDQQPNELTTNESIESVHDSNGSGNVNGSNECNGTTESEMVENQIEQVNGNGNENENGNENDFRIDVANPELEKQLADVQKQLEALSHLPTTIQATLEAVTKQIAEIMPAFKIRTSVDISGSLNEDASVKLTEQFDAQQNVVQEIEHSNEETDNEIITTDSASTDITFKEHTHATIELSTNQTDEMATSIDGSKSKSKLECHPMQDMTDVLASNADEQVAKLKIEKCFKEQEEKWLREREQVSVQIEFIFLFLIEEKIKN